MGGIKEKRYIKIPNFFTKEELDFLQIYTKKIIKDGNFIDGQCKIELNYLQNLVFASFHESKTKLVEEISKLNLLPTYNFARIYTHHADLSLHKDKPTCEISVTASIDSCGTDWPITMDEEPISLKPGEACLYLGCEVEHGRDYFKGLYAPQVFFHWVDKFGPFAQYKDWPVFWNHPNAKEHLEYLDKKL